MRLLLNSIFFFIVTILLLLAISAAVFILVLNYDSLVASVVSATHKNGLEEKIRNNIFSRNRFILLQRMSWFVFLLAPFCYWLAVRYRKTIMSYGRFLFTSVLQSVKAVKNVFKNNPPRQNREVFALMFACILFLIYFMNTSFLTYDEMWSYNYYTANPFYYSFFAYSSYPLFETTTHFFKWLPFSMKINLRLSPLIFGIASFFLLYACVKKYFNSHLTAMAALAAFAFMPLTVVYMINARGVMHELFFAIAGIFSFLFWINDADKKKYLTIYFIAAVLGLYSMTTHALFLLIVFFAGLWVLKRKKRLYLVLFVKINLLIAICFLILYAPILLTTGMPVYADVITQAPSFKNVFAYLPYYIYYMVRDYSGPTYMSNILFISGIVTLLLLKNRLPKNLQLILVLTVILPVSAILFYLSTRFLFAGRSLAFGSLSIPLLACLLAELAKPLLIKSNALKNIAAFSAVIAALFIYTYIYFPVNPIDEDYAAVSKLFINNKIASCYDNSSKDTYFFNYYPGIEYYYRLQKKDIAFSMSQKNSMRYRPLLAGDLYDCIVYDSNAQDSSRAASFHELYRDTTRKFKIWIRNDLK